MAITIWDTRTVERAQTSTMPSVGHECQQPRKSTELAIAIQVDRTCDYGGCLPYLGPLRRSDSEGGCSTLKPQTESKDSVINISDSIHEEHRRCDSGESDISGVYAM